MIRRFVISTLLVTSLVIAMFSIPAASAQTATSFGVGSGPCNLAQPAFCDPMSQPKPNGTRSGDLDGVVWGASRFGGNVSAQGIADLWAGTQLNLCGTLQQSVLPPQDIRICNGQMVEAADDHGGTLGLAAYPKQPFDFAGRVGTVTFDVGNDSQGTHAAWPQFVMTDQPIPVPHPNVVDPTTWNLPNNAIGISFAAGCGSCPGTNFPPSGNTSNCWTADEAWLVSNHQLTTYGVFQNNGFVITGCVIKGTVGQLNHVAIQLSTTSPNIRVFATDPGSTTYREIAEGTNMPLPLTRGLTWLEDDHYNGCKDQTPGPQCQQQHTFAWANWGFDGPILPRDLTFDVPDNTKSLGPDPANGQPDVDLGYLTAQGKLTLQIPNVQNISKATGALLVFNAQPVNAETVNYSLNGHAAKSFALSPMTVSSTVAIPVTLTDLVTGTNSVTFSASDTANMTAFANMNLILIGAGGTPSSPSGTPAPATSTPIATNTPAATSTPPPTATPISTPTAVPAATSTPTSGGCTPASRPASANAPLVGSTVTQMGSDCALPGQAEAFRFTADASGNASAVHVFIGSATTASSVVVGLYSNSPNNHPANLVAQTTISNPTPGSWSSAAVPKTAIKAGQVYWIAILQPANISGTLTFEDTLQGGGASEMSGQGGATVLPTSWVSGASTNTSPASAYVATQ